jgi:hypothetical protein
MKKKYQPKYDHDHLKIIFDDYGKRSRSPGAKERRKSYVNLLMHYNDLFKHTKRTSEVVRSLDNLQDKINGKTN